MLAKSTSGPLGRRILRSRSILASHRTGFYMNWGSARESTQKTLFDETTFLSPDARRALSLFAFLSAAASPLLRVGAVGRVPPPSGTLLLSSPLLPVLISSPPSCLASPPLALYFCHQCWHGHNRPFVKGPHNSMLKNEPCSRISIAIVK